MGFLFSPCYLQCRVAPAKPAEALQRNLFLLPCPGVKIRDRGQLPHKWEPVEVCTLVELCYKTVLGTIMAKELRNVTGTGER